MDTPDTPKDTAARNLAHALRAAAESPDPARTLADALRWGYTEAGRYDGGAFPLALLRAVAEVMDEAACDHHDLGEFYAGEADYENSDHEPDDCRAWSETHGAASDAFEAAQRAVEKAAAELESSIKLLDL